MTKINRDEVFELLNGILMNNGGSYSERIVPAFKKIEGHTDFIEFDSEIIKDYCVILTVKRIKEIVSFLELAGIVCRCRDKPNLMVDSKKIESLFVLLG